MIEQQKEKIEQYLYETLKSSDEESMRIIFYDLSDSYFEGSSCQLASPGRTRSHGFKKKRIILSLLVNRNGYPFSWDILKYYTADVKTLTGNADRWKQKFNLPKVILVFDRGMVSDDNLLYLEESENYLCITAMDRNQLSGIVGFKPGRFKDFTEETTESEILSKDLIKYDDSTYYEDLEVDDSGRRHILVFNHGVCGSVQRSCAGGRRHILVFNHGVCGSVQRSCADGRRHILVFNQGTLKDQRKDREKLLLMAEDALAGERISLMRAKKSRNEKLTEKRIDEMLKKSKVNGYLDYSLESVDITTKEGSLVRTFNLKYRREKKAIKKAVMTDGMWMLVTNISETTEPEEFRLSPEELIRAYRDRNRMEEGFKEVKSFLKFQPTYVYTDRHVRAHYIICILAYLLDVTVTNKLRESPVEDVGSVSKVYSMLARCEVAKLSVRGAECVGRKLMPLTGVQKSIMGRFDCTYLMEGSYLKSIRIE